MNKLIILAAVATLVAGEAPAHVGLSGGYSSGGGFARGGGSGGSGGSGLNEYVDEALLARVGDLISRGGDGSGTPQGTEGLRLDADILTRVSGSIDGGSSSGGPSSGYGPPAQSGSSSLGQPEPAQRIAEFELTDSSSSGNQGGGYDAAPAPAPAPEYGAPSRSAPSGNFGGSSSSSGGQITLGRPMAAQRVADFAVSGGSAGGSRGGSSSSGGYN